MCMTYYTVDDLRPGRPGWDVWQFSALAEAIDHYRPLPMDGAANGVRRTAKTVMGIPELVFLTPAGFFQRVGAEYQHLSGIVLLGAVTDTMLRAKEI